MPEAISNTSPLLHPYRIEALDRLHGLFTQIWTPMAVVHELQEGRREGYDVPNPADYTWLHILEPRSMPSEWLILDLGAGELAAPALALENPTRVVPLDDGLARRIAQAAGLMVWGTLKVLLEAKSQGLTESIASHVNRLEAAGMWISDNIGDSEQQILEDERRRSMLPLQERKNRFGSWQKRIGNLISSGS